MPTKYATQPQWRQRRQAIGRKAGLEADMLFDSEPLVAVSKPTIVPPSSPVTIESSLFDMAEIKPLLLPGSWTTVGKGGRPLRVEQKMYDAPLKKKRQRERRPKKSEEEEGSLAEYEEMPSSSNCLVTLSMSMLKHQKAVDRKHQAKYWDKHRQERTIMAIARDNLVAELAAEGALDDDEVGTPVLVTSNVGPVPKKWRHSRSHRVERIRRKARLAAAAAQCYFEPEDEVLANEVLPTRTTKGTATSAASPSIKQVAAGSSQLATVLEDTSTKAKLAEGKSPSVVVSKKGRHKQETNRTANSGKNCSVM